MTTYFLRPWATMILKMRTLSRRARGDGSHAARGRRRLRSWAVPLKLSEVISFDTPVLNGTRGYQLPRHGIRHVVVMPTEHIAHPVPYGSVQAALYFFFDGFVWNPSRVSIGGK